jgi:hypothetical protein
MALGGEGVADRGGWLLGGRGRELGLVELE